MTSSSLEITPRATRVRGAVSNHEPATVFYLGTHHPGWLAKPHLDGPTSTPVPLFVSDRRLRGYKALPRAVTRWALDSGGFTEIATHGTWDHGPTPVQYAARIRRYADEVGNLDWAAPQDWMCEPWILAKTGLTIHEHQIRTVANFLELRDLAPDLPIIPVLQGWHLSDYLRCAELYRRAGVDLTTAPLVGLGSVCRRQSTTEAVRIITALHTAGITRLHGFGFKIQGLSRSANLLASADSMAWSYSARRRPPLPECTGHINCANCPRYAYRWYRRTLTTLAHPTTTQLPLFTLPGRAA